MRTIHEVFDIIESMLHRVPGYVLDHQLGQIAMSKTG